MKQEQTDLQKAAAKVIIPGVDNAEKKSVMKAIFGWLNLYRFVKDLIAKK